ncbi:hypothetical protein IP92_00608 [Pseudoduganella flava]|uniref:Uncharacterized protein n=1 Tax=Pseudoduganella flava TaxID=871742 RepID=A0A562Q4E1_9BURK|nr:hypothetical protein [Pseudoduganella flava]QGZ41631.1 hypothetical protein GO485_22965 [Pseudoduganella flava]TWI51621.1 hypothetical protein IP92_00608 [Pseudoduganella flava]
MKKFGLLCAALILGIGTVAAGLYAGATFLRETSVLSADDVQVTTSLLLLVATCALIFASVRMARKPPGSD